MGESCHRETAHDSSCRPATCSPLLAHGVAFAVESFARNRAAGPGAISLPQAPSVRPAAAGTEARPWLRAAGRSNAPFPVRTPTLPDAQLAGAASIPSAITRRFILWARVMITSTRCGAGRCGPSASPSPSNGRSSARRLGTDAACPTMSFQSRSHLI